MKNQASSYAFGSAFLYSLATPISKLLLRDTDPIMLAGILYFSAGLALSCIAFLKSGLNKNATIVLGLDKKDWGWFAGVVLAGGILAPLCLLKAMNISQASSVSLLFNLEIIFAVLIAHLVFKEHISRRDAGGLLAIILGGICLSWCSQTTISLPSLLFMSLACLFWAIDGNFTCQMRNSDPIQIARLRGLIAGSINLGLALLLGKAFPSDGILASAAATGAISYGIGLTLYIVALHKVGTAKTTAFFASEPFMGALLSVIILQEPFTANLVLAMVLMGLGVAIHLTEARKH